ncbi:MAG TPA: hypothetical protein VNR65_12115, partial [Geobacterales bacterium]|nr:hypothetical protein [Geobacterales bacterium]
MRDSSFFVRSTDLTRAKAALINGRPAAASYNSLIGIIERRAGAEAASLFAEPVFPAGNDTDFKHIVSWYSVHEGAVVELDALDEAARKPAVNRLNQHLQSLSPLLQDKQLGTALSSWLNLTSPKDILLIGGEPVLINWGFIPEEAAPSKDLRQHQFLRTLGRFAEWLPLPALEASTPPSEAPLRRSDSNQFAVEGVQSMQDNSPGGDRNGAERPWLAPLVASAIALAVLLVLLIPGVLRYPDANAGLAANRLEEERLRASNDSLEQQLKALEAESTDRTCRPAGLSIPVPGLGNGQDPAKMEA